MCVHMRKKLPKVPKQDRSTALRAFRFDSTLVTAFERECQSHLQNPRLVLEALIAYWLSGGIKTRRHIAAKHMTRGRSVQPDQ